MSVALAKAKNGITSLNVDGCAWMSDAPHEVEYAAKSAAEASGNVLCGGWGIGLFQRLATENPNVNSITTVELDQLVLDVCPCDVGEVVVADVFDYLRDVEPGQYGYAYLDVHKWHDETFFRDYIVPFHRLCSGKIPTVNIWHEEEGVAVVAETLERLKGAAEMFYVGHYRKVFLPAAREMGHAAASKLYVSPGTDAWEEYFGNLWDAEVAHGD